MAGTTELTHPINDQAGRRSGSMPHGLVVTSLGHAFDDHHVVDDVSFSIPPGAVHCLMGPSGCGKTTTLRLIAGLNKVQQGHIFLDGRQIAAADHWTPPEHRGIGLMFQDLALFPHLTVEENIAFGIRKLGVSERRRRVENLLATVSMDRHAKKYPDMLSGGEKQRVALARALAPEPHLMLLDEAFSALDASLREEVRAEILSVLRARGVPTLLVTHDPEEAIASGDCIHVMQHGSIIQSGTPDELYERPKNSFVTRFFGPVLRFKSTIEHGQARTPFGPVDAAHIKDGLPVDVMLRSEAIVLRLPLAGEAGDATVVDCRRMGPSCVLTMKLRHGPIVTVKKPSDTPHEEGMPVCLELDNSQAFVFASR